MVYLILLLMMLRCDCCESSMRELVFRSDNKTGEIVCHTVQVVRHTGVCAHLHEREKAIRVVRTLEQKIAAELNSPTCNGDDLLKMVIMRFHGIHLRV